MKKKTKNSAHQVANLMQRMTQHVINRERSMRCCEARGGHSVPFPAMRCDTMRWRHHHFRAPMPSTQYPMPSAQCPMAVCFFGFFPRGGAPRKERGKKRKEKEEEEECAPMRQSNSAQIQVPILIAIALRKPKPKHHR